MVKDDLLQKQFDKGWAKAIPLLEGVERGTAEDVFVERYALDLQLASLRRSWEGREIRCELLAGVPENCPSEYEPLVKSMRYTEEKLAELGINEEEPNLLQAKKDLEENRKQISVVLAEGGTKSLFSKRAYWEETVCYFVRDLKQLEIEVRWVASSEYQQEKQRLECTVLSTRSLTGGANRDRCPDCAKGKTIPFCVKLRTLTGLRGKALALQRKSPRAKRASHRSLTGGGRFPF